MSSENIKGTIGGSLHYNVYREIVDVDSIKVIAYELFHGALNAVNSLGSARVVRKSSCA